MTKILVKRYSWSQLNEMRQSKGELFKALEHDGVNFYYALPQNWLNQFAEHCQSIDPAVTYDLIRSTTVWVYPVEGAYRFGGYPLTCCMDVNLLLIRAGWNE